MRYSQSLQNLISEFPTIDVLIPMNVNEALECIVRNRRLAIWKMIFAEYKVPKHIEISVREKIARNHPTLL